MTVIHNRLLTVSKLSS